MTSPPDPVREKVELEVADGTRMTAYAVRPEGPGPHAGMIVLQEAFGVNSHIRNVADRLAQAGFAAVAPELFHRTAPGFEGSYKDFPSVLPHARAVTPVHGRGRPPCHLRLAAVASRGESGRNLQRGILPGRQSIVSGERPAPACELRFRFMEEASPPTCSTGLKRSARPCYFSGEGSTSHITPEHRKAVTDALDTHRKTYVNVAFSDADHGFFCDERVSYQPRAARQAWSLMLEFLRSW